MRVLRFDDFTLDLSRRVLLRAGNEVALRPQVFDVLAYLAEHHGRVISKAAQACVDDRRPQTVPAPDPKQPPRRVPPYYG